MIKKTLKKFFNVCTNLKLFIKSPKKMGIIVVSIVTIISLLCFIYIKEKNKNVQSNLINEADNIINENIIYDSEITKSNEQEQNEELENFSLDKISKNNNIIGKLKIPTINVEAPIKDGISQNILKQSVGHFPETKYWNGNIVLASHNRGTYAHYFENINRLKINDKIYYQTKLGTRIFTVNKIYEISEKDLSVLNNTDKNQLTMITCIKNKKDFRLCVQASEKI